MNVGSIFNQAPWLFTLFYALNILFLIHAIATRRGVIWIAVLGFSLFVGGFLGPLIYFFLEFLPTLRGSRRAATNVLQSGLEAIKPLDTRIREAQEELAESDTLAHRADLAGLLARAGRNDEAQATLNPLLAGIYADDPVVLLTSAELDLARGNPADAEARLTRVDLRTSAATRTRTLTLLAQAQEKQGKVAEADATYQQAMTAATTEEPRARYAAFLVTQGRREEAAQVLEALAKTERRATNLYKRQEREWFALAAELRRNLK
ncbi:tetratricopeptide repeat protein [Deinococcus puniceus]|uniref:Tetratricopeptide repeat protein n=1 Tax=Deinococcus puniceus TaxID=1182568 RepID=A0A172T7P3_9DEIO|nr:tetratricopeptide repeat protein [Deinococcus puniceus]ANE43000.1 hypothetical protein SU48_03550 [Deinococcus puniceus]